MNILFLVLISLFAQQSFSDTGPDGETYRNCYNSRFTSGADRIITLRVCMPNDGPAVYFNNGQKFTSLAQRGLREYVDPPEFSTTNAANRCSSVPAKNLKSGADVALYACMIFHPLVNETSNDPSDQTFYADAEYSEPISNSLVTFRNGTYYLDTEVPRVELAGIPESFNCNPANPMTDNQCLQCNCYHEARGTSSTEMFYTNRTVHSRVLNDIFPMFRPVVPLHPTTAASDTCGVVYDLNAYSWTSEPSIRNKTIGEGASMGIDLPSYRLCMAQVKSSLDVKDQYFASYYVNENKFQPISTRENAPRLPGWYTDCKSANPGAVINRLPSVTDNNVMVNTTHTYVTVCEQREKSFLLENGLASGVQGVVQ